MQTPMNGQMLPMLGAEQEISATGPAARLWAMCAAAERAEHPSVDGRILTGLIGRRATRMIYLVLIRNLTRRPADFTPFVAALSNGIVREVGESLADFPFEERVRIYEGLTAQLAAGLGIGVTQAEPEGQA
jgi:hypothetical protein